uniref:ARAD1D33330p n=1 Tax=Blastobotrys adeninivorans TaxID=409370 RepID=A0A060TBN2_BLAAD
MYKLSATLQGHKSDVKALTFVNPKSIGSVSRDGTLREWTKSQTWFDTVLFTSPTGKYLNSVSHKGSSDSLDFVFFCAGQEASIEGIPQKNQISLKGHSANVCSLHYDDATNVLISGSWDSTAKVWSVDSPKAKYTLEGHQGAVWDAKVAGPDKFLTCGADKSIVLWQGPNRVHTFTGHEDVVRGLCVIDDKHFASCSNDGTVRVWDLNTGSQLQVLSGHTNYVYQVAKLPDGGLVSVGEDGLVRVWKNGEAAQAIALPSTSVWAVSVNSDNGDFAVGGSDGIIRIFSSSKDRWAPQAEQEALKEAVASQVQTTDIDESQVKDPSVLSSPGTQEGQVVMVRAQSGSIEAHQFTSGEWIRIGEVVSTKQASKPQAKKTFEGKQYDYVFDVDIEEGSPNLPLPYNSDENPYDAARRFLDRHELPLTYLDEVAQFITRNAVVTYKNVGVQNPYADRPPTAPAASSASFASTPQQQATSPAAPVTLKIIPHRDYIKLAAFQPGPIFNALQKVNQSQGEKALDDQQLSQVESALSSISAANAPDLFKTAFGLIQSWDPQDLLPVLDILRISIAYHPNPPVALVVQAIFSTLDASMPKHALLATRALVNLFGSEQGRKVAGSTDVRKNSLQSLHELSAQGAKRSSALDIAIASLLLNYAVLTGGNLDVASDLLQDVAYFAVQFEDSESQYRAMLAVGTVVANNPSNYIKQQVRELGLVPFWVESNQPEDRHKELGSEILSLAK